MSDIFGRKYTQGRMNDKAGLRRLYRLPAQQLVMRVSVRRD